MTQIQNEVEQRRGRSSTWNIRRQRRVRHAADAQLPAPVAAPALDPAPACDDARMSHP
jgi:hypothetical protein